MSCHKYQFRYVRRHMLNSLERLTPVSRGLFNKNGARDLLLTILKVLIWTIHDISRSKAYIQMRGK